LPDYAEIWYRLKQAASSGVTRGKEGRRSGGPPLVTPSSGDTLMKSIFAAEFTRTLDKRSHGKVARVRVVRGEGRTMTKKGHHFSR